MKLFTPGPVTLPNEVLKAMTKPIISHRSSAFKKLYEEIELKLIKLLDTKNGMIAILAGTGTTAVDAMAWSLTKRGEKVLVPIAGEFGKRLAETLQRRGADVVKLIVNPRKGNEFTKVAEYIERRDVNAIALVHNETSTGLTYRDLETLAKYCRKYDIKLLVDAVSSFCGEELSLRWGLTAIAIASHKALAAPPGVCFVVLNEEAIETLKRYELNDVPLLLDLRKYVEFNARKETPYTPTLSVLYAVNATLARVLKIGISRFIEMHRERASLLYKEIPKLGLEPYVVEERYRSNTVATFLTDVSAAKIKNELEKRGFMIATGMGELKERMIRVGTMGDLSLDDVRRLINTLNEVMTQLNNQQSKH